MSRGDTVDHPPDVPRVLVLCEADANAIADLLSGFHDLLSHGALDHHQLLLCTGGRPVPGRDVARRLADVVAEALHTVHAGIA